MERRHPTDPVGPRCRATVSAFIDTNVLVRHLTGDPPELAARATAYLRNEDEILLADLIVAETIYVLESFYDTPRSQIAEAIRALLSLRSVISVDPGVLHRALEVYEVERLDFARHTSSPAPRARESTRSRLSTAPSIGSKPSIVFARESSWR